MPRLCVLYKHEAQLPMSSIYRTLPEFVDDELYASVGRGRIGIVFSRAHGADRQRI